MAGAFRVHRHPGRRAHLLHHAAHPETEHDGVPCGRSLGVPSRAVFPAKPVFLHGDLWPAGSGTRMFSFCFLQWKFLAFHARSMSPCTSPCTCSSSYAFFPWCSASNSEVSLFLAASWRCAVGVTFSVVPVCPDLNNEPGGDWCQQHNRGCRSVLGHPDYSCGRCCGETFLYILWSHQRVTSDNKPKRTRNIDAL